MKIMQLLRDNATRAKQPVNLARNETEATLYIYDVISAEWGVGAVEVISAIAQVGDVKTLNVHISSPGGDVFESRAIMAAIERFPGNTVAHIDGLCASAATSIALSCDEVVMSSGAFFMIHNASGMAWGDKTTLRETADLLEKIESVIVTDYTKKTGKPAAEIVAMMEVETWLTSAEALDHGFVDRVTDTKSKPANAWNLAAFKNAPTAKSTPPPDPANDTPPEPAPAAGFFTSATNQNRLTLLSIQ